VNALVRGELIKLRTTRTALGFAAAGLLLVLAVVLITILAGKPTSIPDKRDALNFGNALSAVLLLFGVVGAAAEYRHRTLAPALLIAPDRGRLTFARMLAYAAAALAIALAMLVVTFVIGIPLLGGRPGPDLAGSDYARLAGGGLLVCVLDVIIGVGIGTLVRAQVPAVIGTLIWFFILEPLIPLISDDVSKFTIGQTSSAVGGTSGDNTLAFGPAVAVLVAWAVIFMVIGVLVDRRRDVT
jgi:ABC-type transport system involved in multi-copper enzyme maturation permease subunit